MNSAILTLEDLAEYLKLPAATLQQEADRGQLPGRKIGDDWRFLRAAIDDWLRADAPHHHNHHDHHDHDNRPIFPLKPTIDRTPIPKSAHPDAAPDNPWARFIGIDEDDPEVAAIAAELRAESADF